MLTEATLRVYRAMIKIQGELPRMGPTLEEVSDELGLSGRGTVHPHVQRLIDAGMVEVHGTGARKYVAKPPTEEDDGQTVESS